MNKKRRVCGVKLTNHDLVLTLCFLTSLLLRLGKVKRTCSSGKGKEAGCLHRQQEVCPRVLLCHSTKARDASGFPLFTEAAFLFPTHTWNEESPVSYCRAKAP